MQTGCFHFVPMLSLVKMEISTNKATVYVRTYMSHTPWINKQDVLQCKDIFSTRALVQKVTYHVNTLVLKDLLGNKNARKMCYIW